MTSKQEENWIKRVKRLFKEKPETLRLYAIDCEITVCKKGVSDLIFSDNLGSN